MYRTPVELVKCQIQVQMIAPLTASSTATTEPSCWDLYPSFAMMAFVGSGYATQEPSSANQAEVPCSLRPKNSLPPSSVTACRGKKATVSGTPVVGEYSLRRICRRDNFVMFPSHSVKSAMQTVEELRPGDSPTKLYSPQWVNNKPRQYLCSL